MTSLDQNTPQIESCSVCATLVDVSEQEVFALAHCPSCGTAMRVKRALNQFTLLDVLGVGGMGTVYRAVDTNLNRDVAIKVLKREYAADQESIQKLEREARVTASINHPNVVKVFTFGSAQGQFYLAMELVEKGSLDDLMTVQKQIAEMQVLTVGIQIAQGLDAAYQLGLIHSDVKPGNILFADSQTAKIVDFGLASLMEEEAEKKGEIWGTPYYVSPERLNHNPEDFRSDLYSLGATLFHALAGRPPFEAENASLVALKHVRSKAVSLQAFAPEVSGETAFVINRMLQKNPEDRYASYAELIEHLTYAREKLSERIANPRKPKARVVTETEATKTLAGTLTLVALALVILLAIGGFFQWKRMQAANAEENPTGTTPRPSATVAANAGKKFDSARNQLLAGDARAARVAFQALRNSGPLPQPMKNWTLLFEGTAALLEDDTAGASGVFSELNNAGMYSMDPSDHVLANFFLESGRILATNKPIGSSTARLYSRADVEALAIFLFGLKNRAMGNFEDAVPLFRQFLGANPKEPWTWITQFRPIAEQFLAESVPFEKANIAINSASSPDQVRAADKELSAAETALRNNPKFEPALAKLRKRLDQSLRVIQPTPTPTPTPKPDPVVQKLDDTRKKNEEAEFAKLETSTEGLFKQWAASGAIPALDRFKPTDPAVAKNLATLRTRAGWLADFQTQLIAAINSKGYPRTFKTRSGSTVPAGAKKADPTRIEVPVQYGVIPVRWIDLAPATVLEIADYFQPTAGDNKEIAKWRWLTGVYAHSSGIPDRAHKDLLDASSMDPIYRDSVEIFFGPKN